MSLLCRSRFDPSRFADFEGSCPEGWEPAVSFGVQVNRTLIPLALLFLAVLLSREYFGG